MPIPPQTRLTNLKAIHYLDRARTSQIGAEVQVSITPVRAHINPTYRSMLISSIENPPILPNNLHIRLLISNNKISTRRDTSRIRGPQGGSITIYNEVAVSLEDQTQGTPIAVAGGGCDRVAAGLVDDEVAVLLEYDAKTGVGEGECCVGGGGEVEVGAFDFADCDGMNINGM